MNQTRDMKKVERMREDRELLAIMHQIIAMQNRLNAQTPQPLGAPPSVYPNMDALAQGPPPAPRIPVSSEEHDMMVQSQSQPTATAPPTNRMPIYSAAGIITGWEPRPESPSFATKNDDMFPHAVPGGTNAQPVPSMPDLSVSPIQGSQRGPVMGHQGDPITNWMQSIPGKKNHCPN